MLRLIALLVTVAVWVSTHNVLYTVITLIVGWFVAGILARLLTWLMYAAVAGLLGLYIYAQQTDQSFMWLLIKLLF
ncbi:MAG: hypothetical protein RI964_2270 [Pseudomonadota bacterium]|jgi:hypothetical protein